MSSHHTGALLSVLSPEHKTLFKECQEAFNAPCYGVEGNYLFNGLQFNFASPVMEGSANSLREDLGRAGASHADLNDSPGHFTAMTCLSQLQDGIHPGLFHILDLGVYLELPRGVTVIFSGCHRHGGTAPIIPAHMTRLPTDIRITCISYPNLKMFLRMGPLSLCAAPPSCRVDDTMMTPAHVDEAKLYSNQPPPATNRATFAESGKFCMADKPRELFYCRDAWATYLATIKAGGFNPEILPLHEIQTYTDGSELPEWTLGPGGDAEKRKSFLRRWWSYSLRVALTVPLLCKRKFTRYPYEEFPGHLSVNVLKIPVLTLDTSNSLFDEIKGQRVLSALCRASNRQHRKSSVDHCNRFQLTYGPALGPAPFYPDYNPDLDDIEDELENDDGPEKSDEDEDDEGSQDGGVIEPDEDEPAVDKGNLGPGIQAGAAAGTGPNRPSEGTYPTLAF